MLEVHYFLHHHLSALLLFPGEEVLEAYAFSLVLCCSLILFLCFVTFMMSHGQWHNVWWENARLKERIWPGIMD